MRPPRVVWECRPAPSPAPAGDGLDDLRDAVLRYSKMPGARLMTSAQAAEVSRHLTPLERALARH